MNKRTQAAAAQNPFKKQADDLLSFNNRLRQGGALFKQIENAPKGVRAQVSALTGDLVKYISTQGKAALSGAWKKTQAEIQSVQQQLSAVNAKLDETPGKATAAQSGLSKFGSALKTAFTVTGILLVIDKVVEFGEKLIDVAGTGEKYKNQFTRIFAGNADAAKGYLSALQNVADTTNFTFSTLADNASKLASRGIIPTKNELLGLGDAANFIGKDFDQLNEAILDANNSERWKELGFTVKTQGDKMTLSYGDFTKTVENSVKGAYDAIQAFSQQGKVLGSTAEAGLTLSGRLSTLGDTFAGLFRTIGAGNTGVLNGALDLLTSLIQVGIELYKTLSPAIDGVGRAFAGIGRAVGGVFTAFGNFQTSAEKSATTAQTFGYYINKFIINPLVGITLVVAGVIEAFNLIVQGAQLAAAKLSGDTGLEATIKKQIEGTMSRLQALRKEGQALRAGFGEGLGDYAARDNARKAKEAADQKRQEDALANFKPQAAKAKVAATDAKADKQAAQSRETLKAEQVKLTEQLAELQAKYDKERLETLDKNSDEYLKLKRKADLAELEEERQKLIELGQLATGRIDINTKTGVKTREKNMGYQLPAASEALFTNRKQTIINAADVAEGRAAEEAYDQMRLTQRKQFTDAEEAYDNEQAKKREATQRKQADIEFDLRRALYDKDKSLIRQAGESEMDFEKRKNQALLKLRLSYYEDLLKLAEADPSQKVQAQELRETILGLQRDLKTVSSQNGSGPQDLFDLLGIKFDADADKNDQIKQVVNDSVKTVIDGANQILAQQVASDQARIDSIDRQIEAKQREVDIELELSKQGLANNLSVRRQEENQLQGERKKAIDQQRQDQAIQIALNLLLQESEMALAVAKLISSEVALGPIGVIAAGISIAAMLALFAQSITQINSLPQYHDGDEVTLATARSRSAAAGTKRADEVDARLQVGEGVTKKESYQPNKLLFSRLNNLGRGVRTSDLTGLLEGTGVSLPEAVRESDLLLIRQYNESRAHQPDTELHRRVDGLTDRMDTLIAETRKVPKERVETLSNGDRRVTDERGNVRLIRRSL